MDLVIGNTSQLSHYFPEDYIKISSRNLDYSYLKSNNWNSVYLTFAEQRIYEKNIDYITPNYIDTLKIINSLLEISNKIVCYTSCELWSNLSGKISEDTAPSFNLNNEYTISKLLLWNKIKELRKSDKRYNKVVFIHPFYFNSVYRSDYFLFGKIFKSIINKEKTTVGNLDFYRDMVSPQFIVKQSIEAEGGWDCVVGAGKLFNVRDFIIDIYKLNGMEFEEYVGENKGFSSGKEKLIMADVEWNYTYKDLLRETQEDIDNFKIKEKK